MRSRIIFLQVTVPESYDIIDALNIQGDQFFAQARKEEEPSDKATSLERGRARKNLVGEINAQRQEQEDLHISFGTFHHLEE